MDNEPTSEAEYHYLSEKGDTIYVPLKQDASVLGVSTSLDDTRLPRSRTPATDQDRSSSLPPMVTSDKPQLIHQVTIPATDSDEVEQLGLPDNWVIYPLFETNTTDQPERDTTSDPFNLDGHEGETSPDDGTPPQNTQSDSDPFDLKTIDFFKPLSFAVVPENLDLPPEYLSRQASVSSPSSEKASPPSYFSRSNTDDSGTKPPPYHYHHHNHSVQSLFHNDKSKDSLHSISETPPPFHRNKPPHLKPARPLPRDDFTPAELEDLRRKTRHHIRVVTRNSLGLTATLALSGVAPQLLIAATINAYCLGRGAYHLHKHLDYLRWNGVSVRKRDVLVAVTEGVVVKLAFLAITVNHYDFIVLARETLGAHAPAAILDALQQSPGLPGFHVLNEWFVKPTEYLQEHLGLATMTQQAELGSPFADAGTWHSAGGEVLKNMFFVGAIQAGMEVLVDEVCERLGRVTGKVAMSARPRVGPAPWTRMGSGLGNGTDRGLFRCLSGGPRDGSSWGLGRKTGKEREGVRAGTFALKGVEKVAEVGKVKIPEKMGGSEEVRLPSEKVVETIKIEGTVVSRIAVDKAFERITSAEKEGRKY